jgi:hypothetical protein
VVKERILIFLFYFSSTLNCAESEICDGNGIRPLLQAEIDIGYAPSLVRFLAI